jgi:uncharacterized protein YggE
MRSRLLISTGTLLGLLLAAGPSRAADAAPSPVQPPGTVRVVADATVMVKPDLAEVDLGVTTEKPTAAAATSENARKMDQIVEALKKEAGPGGEVKTIGYDLGTRWGEPRPNPAGSNLPPRQSIVGYVVTNTVRVRMADVNGVGRVLDRAFKLGANTVNRVSFTVKDREPAQTEALRAAAAKARARASAMAAALGLRVAHVISISEGPGDFIPFDGTEGVRMMKANAAATPIEAGSLEVRASVTVVFGVLGR